MHRYFHVFVSLALLAVGTGYVQAQGLVSNERYDAEVAFKKLLKVATLRDETPVGPLDFVSVYDVVTAVTRGGCVEGGMLVEASVVVTDGALWAAHRGDTDIIPWLLAHEIAHLERRASSPTPLSCDELRRIYEVRGKFEEMEADQESILLLTRAGYADAEGIAIRGLEMACTRTMTGCPQASSDHPGFRERVASMQAVGELNHFLSDITEPYIVAGSPGHKLLCTGFRVSPYRNAVMDIVASAGHCWESSYRNEEPEEDRQVQMCTGEGNCYRVSLRQHRWAPIGVFTEDPLDFVLMFQTGGGTIAPHPVIPAAVPVVGTVYYGLGIDAPGNRGLSMLEYVGNEDGFLKFRHIGGLPMDEGSSGSPVISASHELIGISSNMLKATGETRATDMRLIMPLLQHILDYSDQVKH